MTVSELQRIFCSPEWPEFLTLELTEDQAVLAIFVHPEITWFKGHFPGQAVLPGVVQTHWAAELGKLFLAVGDDFSYIDNLKFHLPILPGQTLDLILQFSPNTAMVKFHYRAADRVCSEGRLVF